MSGMDQAVQDGIGNGGLSNELMPGIDGELTGDEGGAPVVAVIEDFQEVPSFSWGQRGKPPVIDDEKIDFGYFGQELGIRTVSLGDFQVMK